MNLPQAGSSFFVGWGTLSLINAGLAQSKGRSGFGWWLGSLLGRAAGDAADRPAAPGRRPDGL